MLVRRLTSLSRYPLELIAATVEDRVEEHVGVRHAGKRDASARHTGARGRWRAIFFLTTASAYGLVAMEWLFFATKPSFMSALGLPAKLIMLPIVPLPILVPALLFVMAAALVAGMSRSVAVDRALQGLAVTPAVVLLAVLLLLLLDNFTSTVLRVGILRTTAPWTWLYIPIAVALSAVAFVLNRRLTRRLSTLGAAAGRRLGTATLALATASLLVTGIVALSQLARGASDDLAAELQLPEPSRRPNILLISSDGIEANNMSVYGYARRTTPFLEEMAPRTLLCENAFANCARTTGTLTAILTGRLPTETRVIFPPDVLSGRDADLHLPGLLKRLGYRTEQLTIRHYADAYDLNMRNAFDRANFQRPPPAHWTRVLGEESTFLLDQIWRRLRDRVMHVLGLTRTPTAVAEVQREPGPAGLRLATRLVQPGDPARVAALQEFVRESDEPFFAHVHLMVTHGPWFRIEKHVFSPDVRQESEWMVDYYDDSILAFDDYVASILQSLEQTGKLSSTLVVIHSDHGAAWSNLDRIPLMFLFPEGEHAGRLPRNAQTTDIAPTILDYMGLPRPEWMSGRSLLGAELPAARPIISAAADKLKFKLTKNRVFVEPTKIEPPFYTLGEVTLVMCNRAYIANLASRDLKVAEVDGHTMPCDESELPTPQQAFIMILNHLSDKGYDVSAFGLPPR